MKTQIKIGLFLLMTAFLAQSCSKEEGFVGKSEVIGTVTYNGGTPADGAIIYVTFGATEASETYNMTTVADASGKYIIEGLQAGDYYFDAKYTDVNGFEFNTAGSHVLLGSKKSSVTVDFALK